MAIQALYPQFNHLKVRHVVLAFILINFGLGVILGVMGIDYNNPIVTTVVYILGMVATCLWVLQKCNSINISVRQIFGNPPHQIQWFKIIGLTVGVWLFSVSSSLVIFSLLSYVYPSFLKAILENQNLTIRPSDIFLQKLLTFIALVIIAPIAEEFIFRGIILNRWARKWGITKSLIASSILFGFLHINPVGLSMFGLIMGLLYIQTKTLWIPIICHALNNFIVFGFMASSQSDTTSSSLESIRSAGWFGTVLVAISLSFLLRFTVRNFPKNNSQLD